MTCDALLARLWKLLRALYCTKQGELTNEQWDAWWALGLDCNAVYAELERRGCWDNKNDFSNMVRLLAE